MYTCIRISVQKGSSYVRIKKSRRRRSLGDEMIADNHRLSTKFYHSTINHHYSSTYIFGIHNKSSIYNRQCTQIIDNQFHASSMSTNFHSTQKYHCDVTHKFYCLAELCLHFYHFLRLFFYRDVETERKINE